MEAVQSRLGRSLLSVLGLLTAAAMALSGCSPDAADPSPGPDVLPLTTPTSRTDESSAMTDYLAGFQYLRGVNLYTLQQQRTRDVEDVVADPPETYTYLASRGMKIIRLAVPWQGLQPWDGEEDPRAALSRPVSSSYMDLVEEQIAYAQRAGMRIILDLHNGCSYPWGTGEPPPGTLYCGDGLSTEDAVGIWTALSERFAGNAGVAAYNLFNEPRKRTGAETYYSVVNAVVKALRDRGDDTPVWVDTILASSFASDAMGAAPISDPADAVIYSQHFYLHGGSRETLLSAIRDFGEWCDNRGVRCAMGEIGWPDSVDDEKKQTFELAYQLADHYLMDVTYFSATSVAGPKALIAYFAKQGGSAVDSRRGQSSIVERHPSR